MKNSLRRFLTLLFAGILLIMCMPLAAAELPDGLTYDGKSFVFNETARTPASLNNGEVYVYSTASDRNPQGEDLPFNNFNISLHALGQQYEVTTTTTMKYNIAFVLDVSNSMEGTRMTNMITAANGALEKLVSSENQIAIISFARDPVLERGLSSKGVTLKGSGSSSTSGAVDSIRIGLRSDYYAGGTNIQAGLNLAYTTLMNASNASDAVPVIILLSDGAPTYYYTNLVNFRTSSTNRQGDGTSTGVTYSAYTIAQAAYLKVKTPELQIYTIPFSLSSSDSDYNVAQATLNPSDSNVGKLSNFTTTWNNILNNYVTNSAERSQMVRNYPNGTYSSTNSATNLASALDNIITQLSVKTPIQETKVNQLLDDTSFLWLTYNLGHGYKLLGDTVTVTLNNGSHAFTRNGDSYVYSLSPGRPGYNEKISRIEIYISNEGALVWKIPGGVLPCNTPEGPNQVLASPIELNFYVTFDESIDDLKPGVYPTTSGCQVSFTPSLDNPFYYTGYTATAPVKLAENTTTVRNVTQYFRATYPYPGHDNYGKSGYGLPVLTGFSVSDTSNGTNYLPDPEDITVTNYSDSYYDSNDIMWVEYDGQVINFSGASLPSARVALSTTDRSEPSSYTITSFNDGYSNFSDAFVSAVSGSNNNYTIVVNYGNGGNRSVKFTGVGFTTENSSVSTDITAILYRRSNNNYGVDSLYDNGVLVDDREYQVISITNNSGNRYTMVVRYKNEDYTFSNVTFNQPNNRSTLVSATTTRTVYTVNDKRQSYYYTTKTQTIQVPVVNELFRFVYNGSGTPVTLAVQKRNSTTSSWTDEGSYTQSGNTIIAPNNMNGYTITQLISQNTKRITTYYVEENVLYKKTVTVTGRNGVDILTGVVSSTLSNSGSLIIKTSAPEFTAEECVTSATLKTVTGGDVTTATSSGVSNVVLTLTVDKEIIVSKINLTSTVNISYPNNGLPSGSPVVLTPGVHKFTIQVTTTDPTKTNTSCYVRFDSLDFKLNGTNFDYTLAHSDGYPNQQVRVILQSPTGH